MYDSFLYGYGLTLFVFERISNLISDSNPCKKYLDINLFLEEFLNAEKHSRILREFNKYFDITAEADEAHQESRNFLKSGIAEIQRYGFERWVSKNLFDKEKRIPKGAQIYITLLYNYWYNLLFKEILQKPYLLDEINNIGSLILSQINNHNNIFTTNYDPMMDESLSPKHLHGRFIIPLKDLNEIIRFHLNDKEFEYTYLFGTSGIEKASRLRDFRKLSQNYYDLEFFFDNNLCLGHLLIFGLSFAKAEMMTEPFLNEHPDFNNLYLARSVDGHILSLFKKMYDEKRLTKITICYYSDSELKYYNDLFDFTNYTNIVEYINSSEIYFC